MVSCRVLLTLGLMLLVPCRAQDMSAFMPKTAQATPQLEPGEALAIASTEGKVFLYGDAKAVRPMGSLAKLLWIRMYGDEWAAMDVGFNCTGQWNGFSCWYRKGHGRLDLAKALDDSCNLAFLSWSAGTVIRAKNTEGDDITRVKLEEVFKPFMGTRIKAGEGLPAFGPPWIGDGDLLQTSPEQFVTWMVDSAQDRAMAQVRRLLIPVYKAKPAEPQWWMKTGTAPVPGDSGRTAAWVAGSDGTRAAVLYLPTGRGKVEGLARFRAILGLPAKAR